MTLGSELRTDIAEVLKYGQQIRVKYFSNFRNSEDYDDDLSLFQSGTDVWTSGLIQPLDSRQGSKESIMVSQGLLHSEDRRLFVDNNFVASGNFRIGIGSPVTEEVVLSSGGVIDWQIEGITVYKKLYVQNLITGSLVGEK